VPITSIVKEVTEQWILWKTWKVGKSEDAVQFYPARGTATVELVAYGNGPPVVSQLAPLYARKGLAKRRSSCRRCPRRRSSRSAREVATR
jgi:hypothetical protein